ncbi:MAG: hypothetical protein R2699_06835 [Acidimicrobiales bacterium]
MERNRLLRRARRAEERCSVPARTYACASRTYWTRRRRFRLQRRAIRKAHRLQRRAAARGL